MRKLALLFPVLLGCSGTTDAPTAPRYSVEVPNAPMAIVVLAAFFDPETVAREYGVTPKYIYRKVLNGFAAPVNEIAKAGLMRDARVKGVSDETTVSLQLANSWGLDRVDQRGFPLNSDYQTDRTGLGVHAYIVDTGLRTTHTDFSGRVGNGVDVNAGLSVEDCHGHGTHVSGTVGGTLYGVAKRVTVHPVKVFGCVGNTASSIIVAGLDWIAQNRQLPCVVNMSLSGPIDPALDAATEGVIAAGCTVAVAAGNAALDACQASPARVPGVLTVGATDITDSKASFSSWGPCVDLFAPGVGIPSDYNTSDIATATFNGTSMASPHVAGVAALYLEGRPGASPAEVSDSIKAYSTKNIVKNASSANWNLLYSGRVVDDSYVAPPAPSAPAAPSDLTLTIDAATPLTDGTRLVIARWKDNASNELYVETDGWSVEGNTIGGQIPPNTLVYLYLKPGHWSVRVRAGNSGGVSAWSNTATVCIPGGVNNIVCDAPPPPPDTVTPPDTTTPPPCRMRGKSGKCR